MSVLRDPNKKEGWSQAAEDRQVKNNTGTAKMHFFGYSRAWDGHGKRIMDSYHTLCNTQYLTPKNPLMDSDTMLREQMGKQCCMKCLARERHRTRYCWDVHKTILYLEDQHEGRASIV